MLTADDDGDDDVRGDGDDGDDGDDGGADVDGHRSLNNADACEKSNALAEKQHWLWNLVKDDDEGDKGFYDGGGDEEEDCNTNSAYDDDDQHRVWRIYSNIQLLQYIGHKYLFGHLFVSN